MRINPQLCVLPVGIVVCAASLGIAATAVANIPPDDISMTVLVPVPAVWWSPDGLAPRRDIRRWPDLSPPISGQDLNAVDRARAYLVRIAEAGGAMETIGKKNAIGWLHPEYALRAARAAIRARAEAIPANCSSAYRPYGLGIGGFRNKRNSRHTFGLACDWAGIGSPGSRSAKRFYVIASEEGLCNPYGPSNGAEWNHYQLDCGKIVPLGAKVQTTVTPKGPIDPHKMWLGALALVGKIKDTTLYGLESAKLAVGGLARIPAEMTGKHRKATKLASHKAKKHGKKRKHYARA